MKLAGLALCSLIIACVQGGVTATDGLIPPQPVNCLPGQAFCMNAKQLATCTLSGSDAVIGLDCAIFGSSNPAGCVTTGCPAGQAACCRTQKPLWKWNFTQPALVGEIYFADYRAGRSPHIAVGTTCSGRGLAFSSAHLNWQTSACPSDAVYVATSFSRAVVNVGSTVTLPSSDAALVLNVGGDVSCGAWTGTASIDSDLPDWSVTINANCSEPGKTLAIVGTMSGSE